MKSQSLPRGLSEEKASPALVSKDGVLSELFEAPRSQPLSSERAQAAPLEFIEQKFTFNVTVKKGLDGVLHSEKKNCTKELV